jgi:hypothetical protein
MEGMHADDEFAVAFDYASGKTAERFQNPLWSFTEIFLGARFRAAVGVVKAFGAEIATSAIDERRGGRSKHLAPGQDEDSKLDQISGSLIQSLLDAIGNPDMVADSALNYLSAGRDTTGQV